MKRIIRKLISFSAAAAVIMNITGFSAFAEYTAEKIVDGADSLIEAPSSSTYLDSLNERLITIGTDGSKSEVTLGEALIDINKNNGFINTTPAKFSFDFRNDSYVLTPSDSVFIGKVGDNYVLIDRTGKVISEQYRSIYRIDDEYFGFSAEYNAYGVLRSDGTVAVKPIPHVHSIKLTANGKNFLVHTEDAGSYFTDLNGEPVTDHYGSISNIDIWDHSSYKLDLDTAYIVSNGAEQYLLTTDMQVIRGYSNIMAVKKSIWNEETQTSEEYCLGFTCGYPTTDESGSTIYAWDFYSADGRKKLADIYRTSSNYYYFDQCVTLRDSSDNAHFYIKLKDDSGKTTLYNSELEPVLSGYSMEFTNNSVFITNGSGAAVYDAELNRAGTYEEYTYLSYSEYIAGKSGALELYDGSGNVLLSGITDYSLIFGNHYLFSLKGKSKKTVYNISYKTSFECDSIEPVNTKRDNIYKVKIDGTEYTYSFDSYSFRVLPSDFDPDYITSFSLARGYDTQNVYAYSDGSRTFTIKNEDGTLSNSITLTSKYPGYDITDIKTSGSSSYNSYNLSFNITVDDGYGYTKEYTEEYFINNRLEISKYTEGTEKLGEYLIQNSTVRDYSGNYKMYIPSDSYSYFVYDGESGRNYCIVRKNNGTEFSVYDESLEPLYLNIEGSLDGSIFASTGYGKDYPKDVFRLITGSYSDGDLKFGLFSLSKGIILEPKYTKLEPICRLESFTDGMKIDDDTKFINMVIAVNDSETVLVDTSLNIRKRWDVSYSYTSGFMVPSYSSYCCGLENVKFSTTLTLNHTDEASGKTDTITYDIANDKIVYQQSGKYDYVGEFANGFAVVVINDNSTSLWTGNEKYQGLIDINGKEYIHPSKNAEIQSYVHYMHYIESYNYGEPTTCSYFCEFNDSYIRPEMFDLDYADSNNYSFAYKPYEYIGENSDGSPAYRSCATDAYVVAKNGLLGMSSSDGSELIPTQYNIISSCDVGDTDYNNSIVYGSFSRSDFNNGKKPIRHGEFISGIAVLCRADPNVTADEYVFDIQKQSMSRVTRSAKTSHFFAGLVDKNGKVIADADMYRYVKLDDDGTYHLSRSKDNEQSGIEYLDVNGKDRFSDFAVKYGYDSAILSHGMYIVECDGLTGVVSPTNRVIVPIEYDRVLNFTANDHTLVQTDDKDSAVISTERYTDPIKLTDSENGIINLRRTDGLIDAFNIDISGIGEPPVTTTTVTTTTTTTVVTTTTTTSGGSAIPTAITLELGEKYKIDAQNCTFASSKKDVAVVSVSGVITPISEGTAYITVIYSDGETDQIKVTVRESAADTTTSTTTSTTTTTTNTTTTTTTTTTATNTATTTTTIAYGDFTFRLNEDGETLTVAKYNGSDTAVSIPSEVEGKAVTVIGEYSFSSTSCSNIISLTIPEGVTRLEYNAFQYCNSLTNIDIPESLNDFGINEWHTSVYPPCVFEGSPWLKARREENPLVVVNNIVLDGRTCTGDVVIPEGVTRINSAAFFNCSNVTSISIPSSLEAVGEYAFQRCSNLKKVYISDMDAWYDIDFEEGMFVNVPATGGDHRNRFFSNPMCYGAELYLNNKLVTDVVIPDTVTEIKKGTFYGCSSIQNVTVSEGVRSICTNAFAICTGLKTIAIPESLEKIGSEVFWGCSSLEEFSIPECMKTIPEGMFAGNKSLKTIEIPDGITAIEWNAFAFCEGLTSVTVPKSVSSIAFMTFEDCSALKEITILDPKCVLYDSEYTINNSTFPEIIFNGTICGYTGSTAQAYAAKYGYNFRALDSKGSILGDVNNDDSVDSSDAALVLKDYATVQSGGASTLDKTAADYNNDGFVDSSDAALILKAYAEHQAA